MISFALMVKNEEKHLERCLKSIVGFHSEIVVLDTGSTDRTVEIAERYTNKIYHQNWQENFALHRNKSFSYCTGDWIFQIDADEELILDNKVFPVDFLAWLHAIPEHVHAVGILLKDYRETHNTYLGELDVIRIFRRGKVKYRRRIHNDPVHHGKIALYRHAWLKHYGYDLTPKQELAKGKRTIGLLLKSIEEDPTDYESLFYLAQAYGSWGNDSKKALKYAEEYETHKDELGVKFNPSLYYYCAFQYYSDNDMENCKKWIDKGVRHNMQTLDLDLSYMFMMYGIKAKRADYIAKGATAFVLAYENLAQLKKSQIGRFYFQNRPASYATALYYLTLYHLGNGSTGLKKIRKLLPLCTQKVRSELEQKIKADLNQLGLEDTHERKIIMPSDNEYRNTLLQTSKVA